MMPARNAPPVHKTPAANLLQTLVRIACLLGGLMLVADASLVVADVQLATIFSDYAVLQRDRPLPIWGTASPSEEVTVELGESAATAVADKQGNWKLQLAAQPMCKTPLVLRATGDNVVEVRDILLGDVWICGGQSNMEWALGGCEAPEDIASSDLPLIRQFRVEMNFSVQPTSQLKGSWAVSSPTTSAGFTAVGFYFARKVQHETGVPIGLVRSCVGGTNIELWLSEKSLLHTPALEPYANLMRQSLKLWRSEVKDQLPKLDAWSNAAKQALEEGSELPAPPRFPEYPFGERMFRPRCVT